LLDNLGGGRPRRERGVQGSSRLKGGLGRGVAGGVGGLLRAGLLLLEVEEGLGRSGHVLRAFCRFY
jgi:hypothetical protein